MWLYVLSKLNAVLNKTKDCNLYQSLGRQVTREKSVKSRNTAFLKFDIYEWHLVYSFKNILLNTEDKSSFV